MDRALRTKLIRLAHAKPELRPQILPLLTKRAFFDPDLDELRDLRDDLIAALKKAGVAAKATPLENQLSVNGKDWAIQYNTLEGQGKKNDIRQPDKKGWLKEAVEFIQQTMKTAAVKQAGCEKLPEALRKNCEKKQDEGKESDKKASQRKQAVSEMTVGVVYELLKPASDMEGVWFKAESEQKNGGMKGKVVEWMGIKKAPNKPFQYSVQKTNFDLWRKVPDVPPEVKGLLKAASTKVAHGAVALRNPEVMLYVIDPADNKSKFYEMDVVPQGQESPALKSKDFSRGAGGWVLMKRWGRLTDKGGVTGRVDSINETYDTEQAAKMAMMVWKQQKIRSSGYTDVSSKKTYPIGLGGAGFGWGGQAACAYVPELKVLSGLVTKSKMDLMGMSSTLTALERRNSGMAKQISALYADAMGSLGKLDTYLEGQLSAC